MKLKKLAKVLLVSTLAVGLLTGCSSGSKDDKTIKVGASPTPHAEILEVAKPLLEKEGYKLEVSRWFTRCKLFPTHTIFRRNS